MEAIEVTARFDLEGKITPVGFTLHGRNYPVDSVGRRWDSGDSQHILAMTPDGQVHELVFFPAIRRWFLGALGRDRRMA